MFVLPGGPGSSYLDDLRPGAPRSVLLDQLLRRRGFADIVLVDQRGFSERGDVLMHSFRTAREPLDQPASLARSTQAMIAMARECVAEYAKKRIDGKPIDLRGYTVTECADDVDDLRRAMGYDKITLVGVSFGSQWSFAVMRRHPQIVARALLGGVEPLDCGYDMPSHTWGAVLRMWGEAEQDPQLKPYVPERGLAEAARVVVERLKREPVRVEIRPPGSRQPVTIVLGHEDFQRAPPLKTTAGPAFVLSLYHGHYQRWAEMTYLMRQSRPAQFPLILGLIDTSLGVTPERLHLLRSDPARAYLGEWSFDSYLKTAEIWPTADVGDEFRREVPCEVLVVIVQGNWDTQTPNENLLQISPYFRCARTIVNRGGHGALGQVLREQPKTAEALVRFLKTGATEGLPTYVELAAPKFDVPEFPAP